MDQPRSDRRHSDSAIVWLQPALLQNPPEAKVLKRLPADPIRTHRDRILVLHAVEAYPCQRQIGLVLKYVPRRPQLLRQVPHVLLHPKRCRRSRDCGPSRTLSDRRSMRSHSSCGASQPVTGFGGVSWRTRPSTRTLRTRRWAMQVFSSDRVWVALKNTRCLRFLGNGVAGRTAPAKLYKNCWHYIPYSTESETTEHL